MSKHATSHAGAPVVAIARCDFGRGWTLTDARGISNGRAYRTKGDALAMLATVSA